MVTRVGGDLPDPIDTETEYMGRILSRNTVGDLGPTTDSERKLSSAEKLRLGYLTGQDEDPDADREPNFMGGVDSRYPEHEELLDYIPEDYRSDGYQS